MIGGTLGGLSTSVTAMLFLGIGGTQKAGQFPQAHRSF
jgi:hypothetical protein